MSTTETTDLIDVIVRDHRDVERVFAELERGNISVKYRKRLVDHVIADLVRHSVAEEHFLYPAVRDFVPDGDKIANEAIAEHAEAERVMKDLEELEPDDPRFDALVETLMTDVRHHIVDEEQTLLPQLRAQLSPAQLADLGRKVLIAKDAAPTRPHPAAPDTPPANLIIDAGTSIVDKVRDALEDRRV